MKTIEHKGILIDLELDSHDATQVYITATVQEGSQSFTLDYAMDVNERTSFDQMELIYPNLDISEIEAWALKTTYAGLCKRVAEYCIDKNYTFSIDPYAESIICRINTAPTLESGIIQQASGEENILELIGQ